MTSDSATDRRAVARGGRRTVDHQKPWYLRRPFLLATASLAFIGWRRIRSYGARVGK